jgi:hypothetical protein
LRKYPEKTIINDETYYYEKILKDDFFSVNVLYKNDKGRRFVLKLSDFRFIFGILFRPFAAMMSSHEYKIYKMVADIEGVPELGPRLGWRGYFHEYIEGKTLHELKDTPEVLPENFFNELKDIVDQVHRRRILYVDMNKKGNIIMSDDGKPFLIDFQISQYFKKRRWILGRLTDKIFNRLIKEDIYHVYKHKKRYQKKLMTEEEMKLAIRSDLIKSYDRFLGGWYRNLKRRIYPSGSNEMIWYKWKKEKDKSKRME